MGREAMTDTTLTDEIAAVAPFANTDETADYTGDIDA